MAEWHIDPLYIDENWTDEMLMLMLDSLVDRKERINAALSGQSHIPDKSLSNDRIVSDTELFSQLGKKMKFVKKDIK